MLPAATLLGVWAAGLLAGVASGLFGVGGGILIVPAALYLVPGTDFHTAKAVSLVVIVASAVVGIWTHHRHRSVDFRAGASLALGGIVGAAVSVFLVERMDDRALQALFGLVLGATGARLALGGAPRERPMRPRARTAYLLGIGLLGGLLSGALGVGGGIVMVPGMVFAGIAMHLAVGTSLVAVLGNAIGGTASHVALGYAPALLALGAPLAMGALPGTFVGSKLAHKIHADRLRHLFGWGLVLVAAWMMWDALP
ncbi:MAG TPA: sulfite exporter TauE/SafE family protein [Candidatus Thermoplasmatota archaeon]|nr:sulfite exporter TauE/SafE family protein [Candidatus Thermoplasmatota archaeon]